jgi:hypothetical protein
MPTRPKTDALRKLEGTGGAYYFWSNAKGLYPLSNLHRCNMRLTFPADRPWVPPFLQGQTLSFVSAEHAYQCLKAKDLDDARSFTEQGCLSWWPEKGHADKRAKDQIGVVAKVAKHLQTRHIPIEHQEEVWDCIHAAKFSEGSDHGARLCATHPHPLVARQGQQPVGRQDHGRQARGPELHGPHAHAPPPLHALSQKKLKKRKIKKN